MVDVDTIEMGTVSRRTECLRPGTMTTSLLKSPLTSDFDGRDMANRSLVQTKILDCS